MEKMNLSEAKVFQYVAEGLYLIGYPKDIEIHSYVGDGERPMFYATYEKEYKGSMVRHIKRLSVRNFVDLMKFALEVNGFDIVGIDIRVRDEEICYSIQTNIASYGSGHGKHKRRR
jgi:hypothetical protein